MGRPSIDDSVHGWSDSEDDGEGHVLGELQESSATLGYLTHSGDTRSSNRMAESGGQTKGKQA